MEHKPALYALIRLHADIGYRIKDNARQAEKLRNDMKHVEAVIRLLEPTFDTRRIAVKRKNTANPAYKRGTIFRAVVTTLRTATAPMTAEELAVSLFRAKGVEAMSRDDRRRMYGSVATALRINAGKTVTVHEGRPRRWSLLNPAPETRGRPP